MANSEHDYDDDWERTDKEWDGFPDGRPAKTIGLGDDYDDDYFQCRDVNRLWEKDPKSGVYAYAPAKLDDKPTGYGSYMGADDDYGYGTNGYGGRGGYGYGSHYKDSYEDKPKRKKFHPPKCDYSTTGNVDEVLEFDFDITRNNTESLLKILEAVEVGNDWKSKSRNNNDGYARIDVMLQLGKFPICSALFDRCFYCKTYNPSLTKKAHGIVVDNHKQITIEFDREVCSSRKCEFTYMTVNQAISFLNQIKR